MNLFVLYSELLPIMSTYITAYKVSVNRCNKSFTATGLYTQEITVLRLAFTHKLTFITEITFTNVKREKSQVFIAECARSFELRLLCCTN